ncbi:heterokaryon incompatibility protein-domain-containing protein [Tricladium varicosporioides]|nr:heterokaryon incompatibility protein-domain-containing protein [Hymenoscyphus varicosporioides]
MASDTLPGYEYEPLGYPDSTRVVNIQPGETSSPLRVNLREIRLQDKGFYEALSYSWATEDGDDSRSIPLDCGGFYIYITKNCEAAIRRFRHVHAIRVMWIDAICINQADFLERGKQVELMGQIYIEAAHIQIWLGEAQLDEEPGNMIRKPCSENFLENLPKIAAEIKEMYRTGGKISESFTYWTFREQSLGSDKIHGRRSLYQGWIDLLSRRWWQRIWVVQEVAAHQGARAMVSCGSATAPYSSLLTLYHYFPYEHDRDRCIFLQGDVPRSASRHISLLKYANTIIQRPSDKPWLNVFYVLSMGRGLQATDPRDNIFGMLEVCPQMKTFLPPVDYTRSKAEVFTDVSVSLLKASKGLLILHSAATNNLEAKICDGLPSWVIDWSAQCPVRFEDFEKIGYDAARGSTSDFHLSSDAKELYIRGRKIDEVVETSAIDTKAYGIAATLPEMIPGWQSSCRSWLRWQSLRTKKMTTELRSQDEDPETLLTALCWYFENKWGSWPRDPHLGRKFDYWYHWIMSENDTEEIERRLLLDKSGFWKLINHTTPLCFTKSGYLVAASCITQPGDQVVVLTGGELPFVLRPVGDNQFQLISPCYLDEIMSGEGFPDDPSKLEYFTLI